MFSVLFFFTCWRVFFIEKKVWRMKHWNWKFNALKCVSFVAKLMNSYIEDAAARIGIENVWNFSMMLCYSICSRAGQWNLGLKEQPWDDGSFLRSRADSTHTNAAAPPLLLSANKSLESEIWFDGDFQLLIRDTRHTNSYSLKVSFPCFKVNSSKS